MKPSPEKKLFKYFPGKHKVDLLFPNSRQAAMGSLGFQSVYHFFNLQPEFEVTRKYYDYKDVGKKQNLSFNSAIIALSIAFELDIINFISALLVSGIEPSSVKRTGPLIVAGGVLTQINPLPLSPFVDIFMIGDGEILIPEFAKIYVENYLGGKAKILDAIKDIPGFWAPKYGRTKIITPLVEKRLEPLHSVFFSPESYFGDMFLIEVGRGCPRKCRFCASSHIHGYEYHNIEDILEVIDEYIDEPGSVIGLIGSALSDYPDLEKLIEKLIELGHRPGISSIRPDALTPKLAELMVKSKVRTLTLAPESGSLRLRKIIGKGISDKKIYESVKIAVEAGISNFKLYFLIGLPSETDDDIAAMIDMISRIAEIVSTENLQISVNTFIPKPHTPFQWAETKPENYSKAVRKKLRKNLPSIKFSRKSPAQETIQSLISNGNEKTGEALLDYVHTGISLKDALRKRGEIPAKILGRKSDDCSFPWDFLSSEYEKEYLLKIWQDLR